VAKKRWFRFHIDAWLNGTFGLTPNEIAALITILCDLYDNEGFARLDRNLLARRCGLRPSSFDKALDTLVRRGKVVVEEGFLTSRAVTAEIKSREKLDEKSTKSREKLAEKRNEISENRGNVPSNTEDRIKKDNCRGSALPLRSQGRGSERAERQTQGCLVHAIPGCKQADESDAITRLRARLAARR
jgi:DNA-binding MarR family transcriptional regulator